MEDRLEAWEIAAQMRRYLEDLRLFEGRDFVVPAGVEIATSQEVVDVSVEIAAPQEAVGDTVEVAVPQKVGDEVGDLESFRQQICECTRCPLGETRQKFVFGAGNPHADLVFIGEAPGAEEDRIGEPFVGAAGQLLTRIIEAMHLRREQVYICNMLKCRPPNNRDPDPQEIDTCKPYLERQLDLIQPKVICTLGRFASQTLLQSTESMGRLRGQVHDYRGIPLVCTYHPAALLRNPQWKRPTWDDMRQVRRLYDGMEL